jgi:hypothetical protein
MSLERAPSWDDPAEFAKAASQQYRRDFWNQQPVRCQVWSEKGTVRGVLAPVLDELGVGFPVHGFTSATHAHDTADDYDGRPLIVPCVRSARMVPMHRPRLRAPMDEFATRRFWTRTRDFLIDTHFQTE